ncbi:MAG TPA: helix-turn-helix domain-containing protein [Fimbriimonadaceae bacterium]|nr:helix-turn-helix domain-containing protein [Fimbriimonadaceae bacterium]
MTEPARTIDPLPSEAVSHVTVESKKEAGSGQSPILAKDQKMKHPHESHDAQPGHNVVRLELVLAPEQLKGFFGAVAKSQHSVLTLREAANLLRVSQKALEAMALDGNVPGMMLDGKWRFTRQALEDWLSAHPNKKEA